MRLLCLVFSAVTMWCSAAPWLTLNSPNGGETLAAGQLYSIDWQPAREPASVLLLFSSDGGETWTTIDRIANNGSYEWTVPAVISRQCRIMIEDGRWPENVDISDGAFAIYQCAAEIAGDLNHDCYVNLSDVAVMAANWLVCANPHDGSCPCIGSLADCDGNPSNGCETNLDTDVLHCGACGIACTAPQANMACVDGVCVITSCQAGYYDCDGNAANGCETTASLYEANNTCAAAYLLPTVGEYDAERSWTAHILPSGDEDWYRIYAKEGTHTCIPGTAEEYTIRVRLLPPQGDACADYDIYLYDDNCQFLISSASGGCVQESVSYVWDGQCGTDDSRYFRVGVKGYSGVSSCTPYTLSVDMWQN